MTIFGYSAWLVAMICAGVFLAAFVDSIGGGGGLISVPVYLLAGLPAHLALGTNKLSSGVGTAASMIRYARRGFADWKLALPAALLALAGAHMGTQLQLMVDERILKYVLLAVLPVVAIIMLRRRTLREEAGEIDPAKRRLVVWGASLLLGIYDGFYGPGTGTFLLLVFCGPAKMDVRTASGSVKIVNFASNMGALAAALAAKTCLVPLGLLAAVFSVAGHFLGAGLTIKTGSKIVRPVIIAVLVLLAARIVYELVRG
jgi:uncharacterized membrane protein YfcA